MSQSLDYNDKVWGLLISMNVGDEFNIIEKVAPERRQKFIEIVKNYIDHDCSDLTYIEFNNEYTKIKKYLK
jgi:hypothetical protein